MPEDATPPGGLASPDALAPVGSGAYGGVAALRLQVLRQQARLDSQAAQLACQTGQIATLAARLRDSEARVGALIPETQALRHEAATLRHEVAALRTSTSWRITWPLRALRRAAWWLAERAKAAGPERQRSGGHNSGRAAGDAAPRE